jgi:hypothetical protein
MAYQPSAADIARVADLDQQEKTISLSPEETAKLDCYLQLDHMTPLAKTRARTYLDPE